MTVRPRSCPTCSSIGPRRLIGYDGQGVFPCPDPWHWPDPARPEAEMPQEVLMGALPDGPDRTGRLVGVDPLTAPAPDAAPQPTLDDLIAGNRVMQALDALERAEDEVGAAAVRSVLEHEAAVAARNAARAALRAALEADATERATAEQTRAMLDQEQASFSTYRQTTITEVARLTAELARLRDTVTRAAGLLGVRTDERHDQARHLLLAVLGETKTED